MLSPSDFNNAVPQFTNGNYASNPLNPQYIAEPSSTDYNRGVEPITTLPAQWWNWFMNKITSRFNKVNVYVKNIFNELSQLLSLVSETPSGTEAEPTIGQLKDMFETKYPDYLKTAPALSNTYVPQTTTVNGQALSGNVAVCCVACAGANGSGTAFGTAATVNTGTAAGCIPTVGTALGTTNGQFVATDENGKLKPSGYTASCFRASTWTPTCVACAGCDGSGCAFGTAARCNDTDFRASTWTPTCVCCAATVTNFGASSIITCGCARAKRLGPFVMVCWVNGAKGCDICKLLTAIGGMGIQVSVIGCINTACTANQFYASGTTMTIRGCNASGDRCAQTICLSCTTNVYSCANFAFVSCTLF